VQGGGVFGDGAFFINTGEEEVAGVADIQDSKPGFDRDQRRLKEIFQSGAANGNEESFSLSLVPQRWDFEYVLTRPEALAAVNHRLHPGLSIYRFLRVSIHALQNLVLSSYIAWYF